MALHSLPVTGLCSGKVGRFFFLYSFVFTSSLLCPLVQLPALCMVVVWLGNPPFAQLARPCLAVSALVQQPLFDPRVAWEESFWLASVSVSEIDRKPRNYAKPDLDSNAAEAGVADRTNLLFFRGDQSELDLSAKRIDILRGGALSFRFLFWSSILSSLAANSITIFIS